MTRGSTKILGYGALAMTMAFIASACERTATLGRAPRMSVPGSAQVEPPAPDRIWAGCDLGDDTVDGLIQDMERPGVLGTPVTVAYVEVYTFRNNGGQPLAPETAPEGPHTGPVYCRNPAVTQVPTPVQQTDNIGGGGSTLDLLDLGDASVRYRLNGVVEKVSCRAVEGASQCHRLQPQR
jgi:hypothetical protein